MNNDNIKVFCRFRPFNKLEENIKSSKAEEGSLSNSQPFLISKNSVLLQDNKFEFDTVFDKNSNQEQVYNSSKFLIDEIFNGYNCTIFVYGQTSSGKTHTTMGNENDKGIIPRIVSEIFEKAQETEDSTITISISFIEIYLEKIRDLLTSKDNLRLREDVIRGFLIQDIKEEYVSSYEETLKIINKGNSNRTVAETRMNNVSSRSHSVFILNLEQFSLKDGTRLNSKLFITDLAGSEKVSKTNASGITLLQAQYTNKSLSALSLVIKALTEKSAHIPYRDSKLTKILSNSLGGNSKTLLIITCSPSDYNYDETLSTLRFGARVKTIKNKPIVNLDISSNEYKKLLLESQTRIKQLEEQKDSIEKIELKRFRELEDSLDVLKKKYEDDIDDLNQKLEKKDTEINEVKFVFNEQLKDRDILLEKERIMVLQKMNDNLQPSNIEKDKYVQKISKAKDEIIKTLEAEICHLSYQLRVQKDEYDLIINGLKRQLSDLHNELYMPIKRNYIKIVK